MIGSTISHYRILEKIGEGGMGAVYRAEDINLKRTVALKFLPPAALRSDKERTRFKKEAQTEAALDHPNICTIYGIEEADGLIFIAMAFVHGTSLKQKIESDRPNLRGALDIAIQIGEGLKSAHEKGITHCDIKPGNVMLTERGTTKILDFGLARLSGTISTTHGGAAGTPAYMSPEQLSGGAVDHRADIWAFGVVLYEMLTGVQPFRDGKEYDAAILYAIMNEEPEPPSKLNATIPPGLDLIIRRATAKEADKRYASVSEMLADLYRVRDALSAQAADSYISNIIHPTRRVSLRRTIATSIVLTAVFLVVAFIVVPLLRNDSSPATVAVMDFTNQTPFPHFSNLLAKLLMTDLGQSSRIQILSKHRMDALSRENDLDLEKLPHGFDLCRRAHVRYLILPNIRQEGELFSLQAHVYSADTERELFRADAGPYGQNEIVVMVDELSAEIKEKLRGKEEAGDQRGRTEPRITTNSIEAYMFYDIGQTLYAGHDPLRAIPHVERAVSIDSTFVEAYYFLAILYDYIGDRDAAQRCAKRAAALTQHRGAEEIIKSAIFVHWVSGEWDEAIEYMKRYLELEPHDINMREKLGYVLSRYKNKLDEAITAFEYIVEHDPHNLSGRLATAYNYLGKAYLYSGRSEKALEAYTRYQELLPDKPDPLNSTANALFFIGKYAEAITMHQQVIQKFPKYYVSHKDLGLTYQAIGQCDRARNEFKRYLRAAPEGSLALGHILLGNLYLLLEDADNATHEAETALALDSLSLEAHSLEGRIAIRLLGDTERAEKELIVMEDLLADSDLLEDVHHYHYLHGLILLAEKHYNEGLDVLRNEIETAPRDFSIFLRKELIRGCIAADRTEEANREANLLLELTPNDAELHYLIGLSRSAAGESGPAERHFKIAMETWKDADSGFPPLARLISQLER